MLFRIIILSLCLVTVVSNYFVYTSNINQLSLLSDAGNDAFLLKDDEIKKINYKYPSLAINSVPILTYLSRYDTNKNNFLDAINKLEKSMTQNPYNLYTFYLISRNYIYLNDYYNAERYLETLFNLSPKIESSSSLYFFVLGKNKKIEKLKTFSDKILDIQSINIWSFYLSAIKTNIQDKNDTIFYNAILEEFQKKF
jgi:tetratricopeptide (TPR) repeat protein